MYRFAFSPKRDMHINNLRVALFNYLSAKKESKSFIIRIEDSKEDLENNDKETLEILNLFGLTYDNIYYQSNNLKFHRQFAMSLMSSKKAFSCFCTEEVLAKKANVFYDGTCERLDDFDVLNNENPFVIRIKKPKSSKDIDSFVIMTHDKYPTPNFACATDDMLQGITHVVLEKEQILDTQKQEFIRQSLGYTEKIKYSFISNLKEDISVKDLLESGFLPSAIINYLISPKENITLENALEKFNLKNLSNEIISFDINKLRQINCEHIKLMDDLKLSTLVGFADNSIGKLAKLYTKEANTINEIKIKIDTIFTKKEVPKAFEKEFKAIIKAAKDAPYFEEYEDYKKHLIKTSGLKEHDFIKAFHLLLAGDETNLEVCTLYPHLKNYLKEILR